MKAEILKILEMQQEGKLTRDQAAELLAVLADGAREKNEPPTRGVPRPQGEPRGGNTSSGAFMGFMDSVTEVGSRVGHAAGVLGGEILNAVHRDEGGNSVTLSRIDSPSAYSTDENTFRSNAISLSKVAKLTLTRAELANNTITASKFARIELTDSKFTQCDISGSSLTDLTLLNASIRAVQFAGVKCARLRLESNSTLDSSSVNASSLKSITLADASALRSTTITGCSLADVTFRQTILDQVKFADCKGDALTLEGCTFTNSQLLSCKLRGTILRNVKLENKTLRNLDLSGQTIEGNEAFAQATGLTSGNP